LFEAVERTALKHLPAEPYVLGQWSIAAMCCIDPVVGAVGWVM